MTSLPFEKLAHIQELLTDDLLDGLVAVFSRQDNDSLLLVYVAKKDEWDGYLPNVRIISLDDLRRYDISSYDGPVVGYSAIDVIRMDIPTKGSTFHGLGQILHERGLHKQLLNTWACLGRYLLDLTQEPEWKPRDSLHGQRAVTQVIRLTTPAILADMPRQNLVAFLPDSDLVAYVKHGKCRLVYQHSPVAKAPSTAKVYSVLDWERPEFLRRNDYVIALEEMCLYRSDLRPDDPRFEEFRTLLRQSSLDDCLQDALRTMAVLFYRQWERHQDRVAWLQTAFALVVENWLAKIEIDDLVGVLPCDDFDRFLTHGNALYLDRQLLEPIEGKYADRRLPCQTFLQLSRLPAGYGRVAFSLLPLRLQLQSLGVTCWQDLGPILQRTGRTDSLARSAWLLVRDLMDKPRSDPHAWLGWLSEAAQTIAHSCELQSLDNPWSQRQGRHQQVITGTYSTLSRLLDKQAQSADELGRLYYQALSLWYGCGEMETRGIESALEQMVELLHKFE